MDPHRDLGPSQGGVEFTAVIRSTAAVKGDPTTSKRRAHAEGTQEGRRPTVLWLTPLTSIEAGQRTVGRYTMTQQGKQFSPHLLVVPTGSVVSFPNADAFFHNVFSLFNGRRFDLGLYQAGQSREVAFGREGISYIFCNIHPEMSAVIISLNTPYWGIEDGHGVVSLHGVPEGRYMLEVWSESSTPEELRRLSRAITIGRSNVNLGEIEVPHSNKGVEEHLNKFGVPYDRHVPPQAY